MHADVNAMNRRFMEGHATIINEEQRKLSIELISTQKELAATARDIASSVGLAFREMTENLTVIMKGNHKNTAATMKENTDIMVEFHKKCVDQHEENTEAINTIDERLGERLLLRQVNIVKGFEAMAVDVVKSSHKMANAQTNLITGLVSMTENMNLMSNSMATMVESNEALKKSQLISLAALEKADAVIVKVTDSLEYLTDAQERVNAHMYNMQVNSINRTQIQAEEKQQERVEENVVRVTRHTHMDKEPQKLVQPQNQPPSHTQVKNKPVAVVENIVQNPGQNITVRQHVDARPEDQVQEASQEQQQVQRDEAQVAAENLEALNHPQQANHDEPACSFTSTHNAEAASSSTSAYLTHPYPQNSEYLINQSINII